MSHVACILLNAVHLPQPCFGRYLADWIAQCGVDTVRLGFLNEPATEGFCYISSKTPTDHRAAHTVTYDTTYHFVCSIT